MKSKSLIKMIEMNGWELNRVKGSSHVFTHSLKERIMVVLHPREDIPKKTVNSILKQVGL